MLKFIRYFVVTIIVMLSISSYAQEKLTFDNQHSYVLWRIKHLGFSTQSGKWFVDGFVILDKDQPQNSKVEATIDLSKMITGIAELDEHLRGKTFFDVKQFPTAKFISDKVDVTSKTTAKVHGNLTFHGVTKPVTLMVTLNQVGENPINGQQTVGFSATTEIKRSDFGMNTLLPSLGDEVAIEIGAEAFKPK